MVKRLFPTEEVDKLETLDDRHKIFEAFLFIEECIDAILALYLPNLTKTKLYGTNTKSALTFDQKLELFEYFLTEENKGFSKFPRQLQAMRNKVAHSRDYKIDGQKLKEFYKELSSEEKKFVNHAYFKGNKKIQEMGDSSQAKTFPQLPPQRQFFLLVLWFITGIEVEISRGSFLFTRNSSEK